MTKLFWKSSDPDMAIKLDLKLDKIKETKEFRENYVKLIIWKEIFLEINTKKLKQIQIEKQKKNACPHGLQGPEY